MMKVTSNAETMIWIFCAPKVWNGARKIIDMTGSNYGRSELLTERYTDNDKAAKWLKECDSVKNGTESSAPGRGEIWMLRGSS